MMTGLITINLYDGNDNVTKTLSRTRIPWGVLKNAIRMASTLDENNITEADLDAIAGLISDAFAGEVSVQELNQYGDIAEMLAAIQAIIDRASATVPNPKPPA